MCTQVAVTQSDWTVQTQGWAFQKVPWQRVFVKELYVCPFYKHLPSVLYLYSSLVSQAPWVSTWNSGIFWDPLGSFSAPHNSAQPHALASDFSAVLSYIPRFFGHLGAAAASSSTPSSSSLSSLFHFEFKSQMKFCVLTSVFSLNWSLSECICFKWRKYTLRSIFLEQLWACPGLLPCRAPLLQHSLWSTFSSGLLSSYEIR